ncbi:MAG: hypothetical protein K2X82_08085 [Gemmataceae bacterium]|nr:hypothetical protein [Gemmataceae bacterium]
MRLDYVPLLRIQRELLNLPRGRGRFEEYLRTILRDDRSDLELVPLVAMNPMGKEHVAARLDVLLAFDGDAVGAQAAAEAGAALRGDPGEYKAGLVVVDDLMGGWTNRYATEHDFRRPDPTNKRFWVTGLLWSSEEPSPRTVREAVLTAAYRAATVRRHGPARTLRDLMTQEGHVLAAAGCTGPTLDPDDREYTREVIAPFLDAGDKRTVIECLFGDEAARSLGFTPRGLSHWAGLALARHDGLRQQGTG